MWWRADLRSANRFSGQLTLWEDLWESETLLLPIGYFCQNAEELRSKNALHNRALQVGGVLVDLGCVEVAVLHVARYRITVRNRRTLILPSSRTVVSHSVTVGFSRRRLRSSRTSWPPMPWAQTRKMWWNRAS